MSVAWMRPPVRFQSSQASTLPAHNSPFAARACPSGMWSSSQRSLLAENIGSIWRPVRSCRNTPRLRAFSSLQNAALRWHCHTTHGPSGLPVARSQTSAVSRWLLIATAARSGRCKRREALLDGCAGAAPDFQRVLLHPARLRVADRRGLAAAHQDAAGGIDDQGFGVRRALVNGEDVVAHESVFFYGVGYRMTANTSWSSASI